MQRQRDRKLPTTLATGRRSGRAQRHGTAAENKLRCVMLAFMAEWSAADALIAIRRTYLMVGIPPQHVEDLVSPEAPQSLDA